MGQLISGLAELDNSERPEAEALARNIGNVAFLGEYISHGRIRVESL